MKIDYDVILATYNGIEFVKEQIDSILAQTVLPKTIYIRDDLSSDDTMSLLSEYSSHSVIKILESNKNFGYIKNFEKLSKVANSEVVFFSDQDDYWFPSKAEIMLSKFSHDIDLVFSNAEVTDEKLNFKSYLFDLNGLNKNGLSIKSLLLNNFVTGATMAVRRQFLLDSMPFPKGIPHDLYLATSALIKDRIGLVQKPLIKYRQHNNNVIGVKRTGFTEKLYHCSEISKRWSDKAKVLYDLSTIFKNELDPNVACLIEFRILCLEKFWLFRKLLIACKMNKYINSLGFKFFIKDLAFL